MGPASGQPRRGALKRPRWLPSLRLLPARLPPCTLPAVPYQQIPFSPLFPPCLFMLSFAQPALFAMSCCQACCLSLSFTMSRRPSLPALKYVSTPHPDTSNHLNAGSHAAPSCDFTSYIVSCSGLGLGTGVWSGC